MTVKYDSGGYGALGRQVRAAAPRAPGVTSVEGQGKAQASQHTVTGSKHVADGAHGGHDYGNDGDGGNHVHEVVVGQLHAHGSKLAEHDDRISRLEAGVKANLGSPLH